MMTTATNRTIASELRTELFSAHFDFRAGPRQVWVFQEEYLIQYRENSNSFLVSSSSNSKNKARKIAEYLNQSASSLREWLVEEQRTTSLDKTTARECNIDRSNISVDATPAKAGRWRLFFGQKRH